MLYSVYHVPRMNYNIGSARFLVHTLKLYLCANFINQTKRAEFVLSPLFVLVPTQITLHLIYNHEIFLNLKVGGQESGASRYIVLV